MSGPGIDADVALDIRDALRAVDRLEGALGRATAVVVTADARAVTAAIDAAVHNADSAVTIVGDAAELTGEVTAAIDAADTNVSVTADTADARRQVGALADETDRASDSAGGLKAALAGISVAAVGRGLFELATAASDLAESTSKATAVFGESTPAIHDFAVAAARDLGLSEAAALEAAGTFGNLFQALGLSQEAASELSPDVLRLAADLASFNNLGVDDTLEKLRSGLVGEVEPLRGLGISFNAAQVEARALELGLADVNGEISEGAKVQARLSLITEQSAIANGDFARTSDGLANQQRILSAEFQNVAASAGQFLLPTMLDLVGMARDELIPKLAQLAEEVLPSLGRIAADLAPLFGVTLDVLIALAPAIDVLADVLDAIPTPLLAALAAGLSFNRALGLMHATATLLGKVGLGSTLLPLLGRLGTVLRGHPILLLAGALGALAGASAAGANPIDSLAGSLITLADSLTGFGSGRTREISDELAEMTQGLDLTKLSDQIRAVRLLNDELDRADDREGSGRLFSVGGVNVFATGGDADRQERIDQLREQRNELDETAQAEIEAGEATGRWTREQVLASLVGNQRATAAENNIAALQRLRDTEEEERAEAQRIIATYQGLADQYVATGDALRSLRDESPDVATAIQVLRGGAENTDRSFLGLVQSIDAAQLSEEGMANAAALLGTDVDTLTGLVDSLTGAVDEFASNASSALPTVGSLFEGLAGQVDTEGNAIAVSAAALTEALTGQAANLATFRGNLSRLADEGFANLAAVIAERGPDVGGALAQELNDALDAGNREIVEGLQGATDAFTSEWESTTAFFRDVLGPEFILQTGLVAGQMTDAFGNNLSFSERMRIAAALAGSTLTIEGQAVAAIAATEGARAARDYGEALDLPEEVVREAIAAGVAISNAPNEPYETAGRTKGDAFGAGVEGGILGRLGAVATAATSLALVAERAVGKEWDTGSPSKVGQELGSFFGQGVALGIADEEDEAVRQARLFAESVAAAVGSVDPTIPAVGVDGALAAASRASIAAQASASGNAGGLVLGEGAVQVTFTGNIDQAALAEAEQAAPRIGVAITREIEMMARAKGTPR